MDAAPTDPDVSEVEVRSFRATPLPHSVTPVGVYSKDDAARIAGAIAKRIGAQVIPVSNNERLVVSHPVEISVSDNAAVKRQYRIDHLRTNIATLDKTTDTRLLGDLKKEMTGLQAQTPSFEPVSREGSPGGVITGTEVQGDGVDAAVSAQPASLRSMLNRQPAQSRERKASSATVEASGPVVDRGLR